MFKNAAEIRQCADELIASLHYLPDAQGDGWTQANFSRLKAFAASKVPSLRSFYRQKGIHQEFLWDFIAASPETGIFLAAESEQAVHNDNHVIALKHDFEKLLYVHAPIRILVTKAKNRVHAEDLAKVLSEYARGCCLVFNPGAVFIVHFGLYGNGGNVSYVWQSKGEPMAPSSERLSFKLVEPSSP